LRDAWRSGYLDLIRFVGWISVSVDALHVGALHHFFVGAGNPNFGIFEPAVAGGIDGKFARRVFVAEHAAASPKMNLPETNHLRAPRHSRVPTSRSAEGAVLTVKMPRQRMAAATSTVGGAHVAPRSWWSKDCIPRDRMFAPTIAKHLDWAEVPLVRFKIECVGPGV